MQFWRDVGIITWGLCISVGLLLCYILWLAYP